MLSRPHIGSASVDGHVRAAAGVERLSVPAAPTALQAQARDPRHEIELARPCVPLDDRIQTHARPGEGHVALLEHLRRRIVAKHIEPDLVDSDGFRVHVLIVAQAVEKGRHEASTTNEPSSVRWAATFSKQRTWSSWVSRLNSVFHTTKIKR